MIHESIPTVFKYLQRNYGQLTKQELNEREDTMKGRVYVPITRVESTFDKIKLFQNLCILTEKGKSYAQLVLLAYFIFNKKRAFMEALKSWNAKNTTTKTFTNFKTRMWNEHYSLWQVGALTIRESELSYANMLQILTTHQNKLAQEMNTQLASTM